MMTIATASKVKASVLKSPILLTLTGFFSTIPLRSSITLRKKKGYHSSGVYIEIKEGESQQYLGRKRAAEGSMSMFSLDLIR
jgi:hypothetical protein